MALKTKTFSLLGLIFGIATLIFLIVSFASDRWVVSTEKEVSGFKNLGLWSSCFSRYRPPAWSLVDKYYDGCWWVFDREMDDLRHFLFPPWFVGTQVLVTVSLTFELIAIIVMTVNAINCFPYNKYKDVIAIGLSLTAAALHGLTAILLTVAVIMFGARANNERTWLEKPDQNYLSWSFGLCVLAAFLAILAFMCVAVEFHRLRLLQRSRNEPKVLLTAMPPPVTNYFYSRQNQNLSSDQKDSLNNSQPAYVGRYPGERSQNSQNARPPSSPFAVSGAGEMYINHSYVNDEDRERHREERENRYARRQFSPPPYHYGRSFNDRNYSDKEDSHVQPPNSSPGTKNDKTELNQAEDKSNDYEESKKAQHPVLPEYVPKNKAMEDVKKINIDNTLDESCDSDIKKRKDLDSSDDHVEDVKSESKSKSKTTGKKKNLGNKLDESSNKDKKKKKKDFDSSLDKSQDRRKSRSDSKNKKSSRSRSNSMQKKKRTDKDSNKKSDSHRSSKRSKSKGNGSDDSDDEHSHSRHRSSKRTSQTSSRRKSHSRERSSSRHRSRSRDLSSTDSATQSESDSASVASQSRKKSKSDRESSRHRSTSRDNHRRKRHDGNFVDDVSGSEYSSKPRSKKKSHQTDSSGKEKSRSQDYSDTDSVRSRRSRRRDSLGRKGTKSREYSDTESVQGKREASMGRRLTKSREYSDTESVRSKQSKRGNIKPRGTYSSYYEY